MKKSPFPFFVPAGLAFLVLFPATARADLLRGGLLGTLFRGDTFTGPRLVDIIVLGLVVFLLLRLVTGRDKSRPADRPQPPVPRPETPRRPDPEPDAVPRPRPAAPADKPDMYTAAQATWAALKSPTPNRAREHGPTIDVPPAGASPEEEFLAGAKMAYGRILVAMAERDFDDLSQFVTPELLAHLKNQLPETPAGRPDVLLVEATLADSRDEDGRTSMTVDYKALVREPGASQNTDRLERWRFSRHDAVAGDNWLLDSMERR